MLTFSKERALRQVAKPAPSAAIGPMIDGETRPMRAFFIRCARAQLPRGPRGRRAAEQRDELAATDHSITSSARARSVAGTVMPRALAVFMLMTSWNRVGCSTGKSAG